MLYPNNDLMYIAASLILYKSGQPLTGNPLPKKRTSANLDRV